MRVINFPVLQKSSTENKAIAGSNGEAVTNVFGHRQWMALMNRSAARQRT